MRKRGAGPIGQCVTCSFQGFIGGLPQVGASAKIVDLSPVLVPWVDALALQFVADYLRSEAAQQAGSSDGSTKPVPLPALDKAA